MCEVSFHVGRLLWIRCYRPFIPASWIVDVVPCDDTRLCVVTLSLTDPWSPPLAVSWSNPHSLRFSARLWEGLVSMLVPESWVVSINYSDSARWVDVLIDSTLDRHARPLVAENLSAVIAVVSEL